MKTSSWCKGISTWSVFCIFCLNGVGRSEKNSFVQIWAVGSMRLKIWFGYGDELWVIAFGPWVSRGSSVFYAWNEHLQEPFFST